MVVLPAEIPWARAWMYTGGLGQSAAVSAELTTTRGGAVRFDAAVQEPQGIADHPGVVVLFW